MSSGTCFPHVARRCRNVVHDCRGVDRWRIMMCASAPVSLDHVVREPRDDIVRPDRPGQAGVHVEHRLGDRVHGLERLEAAQHDTVRRCPQKAADNRAGVLGDHEGGIEPVEAWLDAEQSEQPEREVVLGFVGGEKRAGARSGTYRRRQPGSQQCITLSNEG